MKTKSKSYKPFLFIFSLLLFSIMVFAGCGGGGGDGDSSITFNKVSFPLTVKAHIDGRSQLMLSGSLIWWHHFDYEPPGLWEEEQPTFLNEEAWYPVWPEGNLTDCDCESSGLDALATPLRADATMISLNVVAGRGEVTIVEQPNHNNDYTAAIDFNDNAIDFNDNNLVGPAWYEIIISYN